ncbi:MAG: DUF72 domain-containing protein [Spirochaetes bacterium]|nr:DUF72 domain-containing protein [Spirochaetota bacterium]
MKAGKLRIGTCSWNYPSWVNVVYSGKVSRSADYLPEYSLKYETAEIDSWFYKIPSQQESAEYDKLTGQNFKFTCKAPQLLTIPYKKQENSNAYEKNQFFLNSEYFNLFLESIVPLKSKISSVMLEFQYLNKEKMKNVQEFIKNLNVFISEIPSETNIAIECRNGNYLTEEYFSFLKSKNISHVFSEKIYMPHIVNIYDKIKSLLVSPVVIRLLGGDRHEMEKLTGGNWSSIVSEKPEKKNICRMINELISDGNDVFLNVNNHYEGSAPLTIESMLPYIKKESVID